MAEAPQPHFPENESPRECCANLAMEFRGVAGFATSGWCESVSKDRVLAWASRLERATKRLDQEKASQR